MRRFQVSVTARINAGEDGMKQEHVDALAAYTESLAPLFESGAYRGVSASDNGASGAVTVYGTITGTVERRNAPSLAGVKYGDPEACSILADDFKKRAHEAGLEAGVSVMSRSAYRALAGR